MGGDLRNVTTCDKGGGVKKSWNSCDVIYGWPLIYILNGPNEMINWILIKQIM